MNDPILFQEQKLTVYADKLTVGNSTLYYPNIDGLSIYSGKPLFWIGILMFVSMTPVFLIMLWGVQLLGAGIFLPLLIIFVPTLGFGIFSMLYKVNILSITTSGSTVSVLKSKEINVLETAKMAIETARIENTK